jgi:hypothetical protein
MSLRRFVFASDIHWGSETVGGHKRPLHDLGAIEILQQFVSDFKPHDFVLGGDILDCGAIARHHNKGKPRKTEGFRLMRDAEGCVENVIKPIERMLPKDGMKTFITGNHEQWVEDLLDAEPELEGLVDTKHLLKLDRWKVIPQGHGVQYHKLYFMHGDTIKGGEACAKAAVTNYERNIRFGHFHTAQLFTKTSPLDAEVAKTGVAVPCLCSKDVGYMERIPNRWVQGFCYGTVDTANGTFEDNLAIVIRGRAIINGKLYKS